MGLFSSAFWRGFANAFNLFPTPRTPNDLGSDLRAHQRERTVWRSGPANAAPLPPTPLNAMGRERYPWYTVGPAQPSQAKRGQRKGSRAQRKKRR